MAPEFEADRYILHEPIAMGGMATVYFARQRGAAGFAKAVAIKRMRPDLLSEREFVDLFLDEARLASRIRHANVVDVLDVVASGTELLLVMEYLHGESLARLLDAARRGGQRVPPAIAVAIMTDALQGLHAAHEAMSDTGEPLGIVHRDVSPQNVFVGVDGVARVVDFGVARAAGQLHATDDGKTRGKARYAAPEQMRGRAIDRRVDVFAACAVLWEALVGRPLFDGESPGAIVNAVLTDPIEPPSRHVRDLPPALDDAIMRGLERDPVRRFATAEALATALERALPPAGAAAVGAWVRSLAAEALTQREAILRRIESPDPKRTSAPVADDEAPTLAGSYAPSEPWGTRAALPVEAPTETASYVDSDRGFRTTSSPRRNAAIWLGLGGALLLAGGITLATTRSTSTSTSPPPSTSTSTSTLPGSPSLPPPSGEGPRVSTSSPPSSGEGPQVSASSPPSPGEGPRAPTSSSTSPADRSPRGSHASPPTPKPAPRSKRCDPPYELDSSGRKIFRVDCL